MPPVDTTNSTTPPSPGSTSARPARKPSPLDALVRRRRTNKRGTTIARSTHVKKAKCSATITSRHSTTIRSRQI
jgi:hypothetical protein